MKTFLISPVRNINDEEHKKIKSYVEKLESEGHKVYWPIRDTNQNDNNGIKICRDNLTAIQFADEIHIWFNPTSSGSLFDLGAAFMWWISSACPKFVFVNKEEFPDDLEGKSFIKVLKWLDINT